MFFADSGVDTPLLSECVWIFPNGAGRIMESGFCVVPAEVGFVSEWLFSFDIFHSPFLLITDDYYH